jgi:hypothetical protein
MEHARTFTPGRRYFSKCVAAMAQMFLMASACCAQSANPSPSVPPASAAKPSTAAATPWSQELDKYPGLLDDFERLLEKLRSTLQFPGARNESRLLPLLPETTMSYAAFSNYGDVIHQALGVFRQELQASAVLRDWWGHGQLAESGPQMLDSLEKFSQLHQYLGDEIVVAGAMEDEHPKLVMVAEVRKPGLKKELQQWMAQLADKGTAGVRVLDVQELAIAETKHPAEGLVVLVRPDFVVAASDLVTLRSFNARLAKGGREFVATPFGQRIVKEYGSGVTILSATDLRKILDQVPPGTKQNQETLQRSGFADVKYLVWEHTMIAGQSVSQSELSFSGPRHGTAAWLANPVPLGSLDFVSPKAIMAATVVLTSPTKIFEDTKELAGSSNANSFAALAQGEQALKLSLRDDLLSHLGPEMTVELDSVAAPKPLWKAILKVDDANHIQQTLRTLFVVAHFEMGQSDHGEVTYYSVRVPSAKDPTEIDYAFVDGYLIVASSQKAVADAVELHGSSESLGKSKKFLAALPPGHSLEASGLLYENPSAMAALQLGQLAPRMAEPLAQLSKEVAPAVICIYGEESAIRSASANGAIDFGAVLVGAAIAIPNLLRSKMAMNEASAVGSVRTVVVAQVTYSVAYPKRGYAPDLATLGPDPRGGTAESAEHAGLLRENLANEACTADAWCTNSGFHFRVTSRCKQKLCKEYVVVATPVDGNTGARSFCATSDGVIRFKAGDPLTAPVSAAECQGWKPLQ